MELTSNSFEDGDVVPARCAFGVPDAHDHVAFSDNRNPHLAWREVPEGAKSLVLICMDADVPSKPDDVNQEDREVPADLPRVEFCHWVMVDIPTSVTEIEEGDCSQGVTCGGKRDPEGPARSRQGINDFTNWFAGDAEMGGDYYGYDGPCPPWNDSIIHHYHFRLYAVDMEKCPVEGRFTAQDVLAAIENNILAEASISGRYSLNPSVRLDP